MSYIKKRGTSYELNYKDPEGRMRTRTFHKKSDAQRAKTEIDHAVAGGTYINPGLGNVAASEWAETWYLGRATVVSPTTRSRERSILDVHVIPRWGRVSISKISHAAIQTWVASLMVDLQPATVRKIVFVLSSLLDLAIRDGRIPKNPARALVLPKPKPARRVYLSHEEVFKLAEACANAISNRPEPERETYRLAVMLLSYCGLRWSELIGLKIADIDLIRRRIDVHATTVEVDGRQVARMPKNGSRRSVPFPDFLVEPLRRHIADTESSTYLIVGTRRGNPLRRTVFRRAAFDPAAEAIGYAGLTPHELRHTTASLAVSVGGNVKAVQRMLGHASASMTLDTYADLFDKDLDAVADALSAQAAAIWTWPATDISRTLAD